jgi:hypothetical protein
VHPQALTLSLHAQRSTELQRQAAEARLAAAVRDERRAQRLAARAAVLTARSQRLAAPRPARA